MLSLARKLGSLLGLTEDGGQDSATGNQQASKPNRLSQLEESPELWTLENTLEWLRLKGLSEFEPLFIEMAIDGDGVLELAEDLFDVLDKLKSKKEEEKADGDQEELRKTLLREMKDLKEKYEKPGRTYLEVRLLSDLCEN